MKRRDFIKSIAAATPALLEACQGSNVKTSDRLGDLLPQRILGSTGENVTMLGVGGYHVGWTTERDAQEVIESALEGGIRFFDSAESYGPHISEQRYGKYLTPKYRDVSFIMTKTTGKDAATVQKHLDESLKRMNTDYLDLWQVHSLKNPQDVDERIENGVLDVFVKAKEAGKVRYIGFTGHSNPEAHLRMLERTKDSNIFDTAQMPINVMDSNYHSFIKGVVPELQKRNIALLAMKTLADGRFFPKKQRLEKVQWETDDPVIPNRLSVAEALNFVWSLPVSVLITGAENADLLKEKIEMAKTFAEMGEEKRSDLIDKVADLADGKVEYFKRPIEA
jgi:uncharacterized protein